MAITLCARFATAVVLFFVLAAVSAQPSVNLGNDVARPIPGAGHDYIGGLSETVNPANGNLTIKIDLPVPRGRGLTLPFAITYNSGEVHRFYSAIPGCGGMESSFCGATAPEPRVGAGWSDTFPYVTYAYTQVKVPPYDAYCDMSSSFNFFDPEGRAHMLGLAGISTIQNPSAYNQDPQCANITYNAPSCQPWPTGSQPTGWWAGCSGGYTFDALASGGDDQVRAQSDLCNGYGNGASDCQFGAPAFTVTDTSGTVYSFSQIFNTGNYNGLAYPTKIEDRNGNIIQATSAPTLSMTDTLGRTVVSITGSGPGSTTYAVGGVNFVATFGSGGNANFTASSIQINTPPSSMNLSCNASFSVNETNVGGMQNLKLPNGQQYTFKYDSVYGLMNEIDYPDGGWVKYTWGLPTDPTTAQPIYTEVASFAALNNSGEFPPYYGTCLYRYQTPVVISRTVGYGPNSSAAQTQMFTYNVNWNPAQLSGAWGPLGTALIVNDPRAWIVKSAAVATTDNVTGKSATTSYTYSSIYQPPQTDAQGQLPAELAVEQSIQYNDWSGNQLETVNKTWRDQFEMTSEQTVLKNGQSATTQFVYTGFPESIAEKDEYDFGQSTPARTTKYAYGFYAEPCRVVTFSGSSSSSPLLTCTGALPTGTVLSETDVVYDGSGTADVSAGLPTGTHDESNYGPSSTLPRGNPTKVVRCLTGTSPSCTGPTTTYAFDKTGQVISKIDPCGNSVCSDVAGSNHTTTYDYTDSPAGGNPYGNSNAYVTKITYPTPAAYGITQQEMFSYDYSLGYLASSTDSNLKKTGYIYNIPPSGCSYSDGLNRLSEVDYPDTGATTYCYDDTVPSVTTSTKHDSSGAWKRSIATLDGFGRVIETKLTSDPSDPSGPYYVDTSYDGEGHTHTKSNPYRSVTDSTYGTTKYFYDALGRTIEQQNPDGSTLQTCYNGVASFLAVANCNSLANQNTTAGSVTGTWEDFTDENGSHWQRAFDSLGRLTQVVEPGTFKTTYQYDVSSNLLCADQWGTGTPGTPCTSSLYRKFSYDNLSNLLSAYNPETGTISYNNYDANGNLQSKTDARNITTTYAYDTLNRLTQKSYSDGTPITYHVYDTANISIGQPVQHFTTSNVVGRLSVICVWVNNTCQSMTAFSYDAMGRVAETITNTPSNATAGAIYTLSANYYLDGNLSSLTYPDGRVITQSIDGTGHLSAVNYLSWNGTSVNYPYLNYGQYWPDGSLMAAKFGSGTEEDFGLNIRLQPTSFSLKGSQAGFQSQPFMDKQLSYVPACGTGTGNNGNIYQIIDGRNSDKTQNFCYDALNRLASFSVADGSASQTYSIDPYGNVASIAPGTLQNNLSFDTNNHINCCGYGKDAAGNVTATPDPAGGTDTLVFDAENRITNYNSGAAIYTYDGDGDRVRKDIGTGGNNWTEYLYFGGQPVAELNNDLTWSDYIFANGKRIARSDSFDQRIHIEGTSNTAGSYAAWYLPVPSSPPYVIQSGDKISWRQYQNSAVGGMGISFTDGTNTNWSTLDTDGQVMNGDNTEGSWHFRTVDLSAFAGKQMNNVWITADAGTPVGSWFSYFADIAIYSTNGSVTPIYYRQTSTSLSYFYGGSESGTQAFVERSNSAADAESPWNTTTYYSADQIGSARMLSSGGGWPVSMDWYYPFGQEPNPPADNNHYKFTGKERDAESGNDYFEARYYASNMGRFLSPDWSAKEEPVPYAKLDDPQTLNLYAYVNNNPLSHQDPDGHASIEYLRRKAVALAWKQEQNMVAKTGRGTVNWTDGEKAELLKTGRVSGFVGHHINDVARNPGLAGEPNNIKFVEGQEGNLAEHGRDFRNSTTGPLLDRTVTNASIAVQIVDTIVNAVSTYQEVQATGVNEVATGQTQIVNPGAAAVTLDGASISTYNFWSGGKATGTYSVKDGQYIDSGTNKPVDPKTLQGQFFRINPTL